VQSLNGGDDGGRVRTIVRDVLERVDRMDFDAVMGAVACSRLMQATTTLRLGNWLGLVVSCWHLESQREPAKPEESSKCLPESPPVTSCHVLAMQKVRGFESLIRFTEPAGNGGFLVPRGFSRAVCAGSVRFRSGP
jgi:hypothetical protein